MADLQNQTNVEKGSDAWNVAQGYTHLKILKPLVEMDKLVKMAIYGTEHIEDSFNIAPEIKTQIRIEAIHRLIDILRETIENCEFAMTQHGTKDVIDDMKQRIQDVESVINGISRTTKDSRTQEQATVINEDHFWLCLESLRKIKRQIPEPLNKNSLIFPTSDEIDLEKLKKQFVFGG